MNARIRELAEQAGSTHKQNLGVYQFYTDELEKFAELMAKEFSNLLWEESERLYAYSSECDDNSRDSEEAELVAEKCVDLIKMVEEHFGVKE